MLETIPVINIEEVPNEIADELWPELHKNGGNVVCAEKDSPFGEFMIKNGFVFTKSWSHVAVFR